MQENRGGPTAAMREIETAQALWWLGQPDWTQLATLDSDPAPSGRLLDDFVMLNVLHRPERVWAPCFEEDGHEQHNLVAFAAIAAWRSKVEPYLTYRRGSMRRKSVV